MEHQVCNDHLNRKCTREQCKFKHVCSHFWRFGQCKFNNECKFEHIVKLPRKTYYNSDYHLQQQTNEQKETQQKETQQKETQQKETPKEQQQKEKQKRNKDKYNKNKTKIKNTESFEPIPESKTNLRVVVHNTVYNNLFDKQLTTKDVLVVPDLFNDHKPGDIYKLLLHEIEHCGNDKKDVFKMWHGDSHLIADDHLSWKKSCPTFTMVVDRMRNYFKMDIKATRFNYYQDASHFKPMHFDASAVKPEKAKVQNFTLAVSFGATRDAAFEHAGTKTIVSLPQPDSSIYAFCKDINVTWRHGILMGTENDTSKTEDQGGRISIICWGWLDQVTL